MVHGAYGTKAGVAMRAAGRALAAAAAAIALTVAGTATGYAATPGGGTAGVVAEATSVQAGVLNAVGAGAVPNGFAGTKDPGLSPAGGLGPVTGKLLTRDGKPELLYIGADWCPYCASEQWAMIVALSRFGRFTGLNESESESAASGFGEYPDTATLRFYGATYTSRFFQFTAVDLSSRTRVGLQRPTAAEQALMNRYDSALGAIPFIDVGNRYVQVGSAFSPQVLKSATWSQIAVSLYHPSSAIARSVDGAANYLTAAICAVTGNRPSSACTAVVRGLERDLG
jgi:thiol-disulfide isomerase/thioredoxin